MEVAVKFEADGVPLAANFFIKDGTSGRVPGIVLAHGFAGAQYPAMAAYLAGLGYGVLAFDFRGYGKSGGERGNVIPSEQVSDIRNAVTCLAQRPEIDPARIGVIGSSLGGSIAIMAAAEDQRIKVCVAGCPLGKGDSALRMLYDTEDKFAAFMKSVEEKKRKNERFARFDIVFIPANLRGFLPPGTPMDFSADTVYGFLALNPLEVVTRLAPRPLFIIHAEDDHVVPVDDSRALAAKAGANCELDIIKTGDHFIFGDPAVSQKIGNWLTRRLPPTAAAARG